MRQGIKRAKPPWNKYTLFFSFRWFALIFRTLMIIEKQSCTDAGQGAGRRWRIKGELALTGGGQEARRPSVPGAPHAGEKSCDPSIPKVCASLPRCQPTDTQRHTQLQFNRRNLKRAIISNPVMQVAIKNLHVARRELDGLPRLRCSQSGLVLQMLLPHEHSQFSLPSTPLR